MVSTGDEHWTKVLQANDALGKLPVCPYHGKNLLPLRCTAFNEDLVKTTTAADLDQDNSAATCRRGRSGTEDHPGSESSKERGLTALFERFCQWLSEARRRQSSLLRLPLTKSGSRLSFSQYLTCSEISNACSEKEQQEEEDIPQTAHFFDALSRQGLNPIKLACNAT